MPLIFLPDCSFPIPEKIGFQKSDLAVRPKSSLYSGQAYRIQNRNASLFCQLQEHMDRLFAQIEQFMLLKSPRNTFSRPQRHRHLYVRRQGKQLFQSLLLHRRKAGKTIKSQNTVFQQFGSIRRLAEYIQHLLRCNKTILSKLQKSLIQHQNIL